MRSKAINIMLSILFYVGFGLLISVLGLFLAYPLAKYLNASKEIFIFILILFIFIFWFLFSMVFRGMFSYFNQQFNNVGQKKTISSNAKLTNTEKKREAWSKYKDEL